MSTAKWDPLAWLELAVQMQAQHPFVPVELDRDQALALLKYIKSMEETLEHLKRYPLT